jgi:AAA ATPase domain
MGTQDGAEVHYALGDAQDDNDPSTLPERYSGLGFKNLIYMVVQLLDLHAQWMDIDDNKPPLHLLFIEEPEAHLHTQLQQVFIRKVIDILEIVGDDRAHYTSQLVVTTHSSHILYERGFRPIRYFRRSVGAARQTSEVLNLSQYYYNTSPPMRNFLERYLKLTHCDLFFADAAILVEGNVERLLLPFMVEKVAPRLQSSYISILEIGGAFGHRFRSLIEFLGITTLIVTDIDSVIGSSLAAPAGADHPAERADTEDEVDDDKAVGTVCMVHTVGAVSSNQTLVQWLPARRVVADLLETTPEQCTQVRGQAGDALIRVCYQTTIEATWGGRTVAVTGRTFEEAFALENLDHCQAAAHAELKLRIRGSADLSLEQLAERLHNRIKRPGFNKTDFALALLAEDPANWRVPSYIAGGLRWLEREIARPEVSAQRIEPTLSTIEAAA